MSNPSEQEWNHWFQALPIQSIPKARQEIATGMGIATLAPIEKGGGGIPRALPPRLGHGLARELRLDHQGPQHGRPGQRGRHTVLRCDDPPHLRKSVVDYTLSLSDFNNLKQHAPSTHIRQDAHSSGAAPKPALVFSPA